MCEKHVWLQALLRAVRQREKSTFHDWLASTRKAAAVVGERAIRRAAGERAHEDRLGQERKMLLGTQLVERRKQPTSPHHRSQCIHVVHF